MNIAGIKDTCSIRLGIIAFIVTSHEGDVLGKLVVLVLIHHLLHVSLANHSASIQSACSQSQRPTLCHSSKLLSTFTLPRPYHPRSSAFVFMSTWILSWNVAAIAAKLILCEHFAGLSMQL